MKTTLLIGLAACAVGCGSAGSGHPKSPGATPVLPESAPVQTPTELPPAQAAFVGPPPPTPAPVVPRTPIADAHRAVAADLLDRGLARQGAMARLSYLTDHIGNRISGSAALTQAVTWAEKTLREDGHVNVRAEKVMVPHWVRGAESADLVAPVARPLRLLGLGGSVGTPVKGITAEVVVVASFDELAAAGEQVRGRIVLYNHAMPAYGPEGSGYGDAIGYRTRGADRASALGAVGVLVRSLTAHSLRTPHTGMMRYDDKQPRIPAAAITTEDAELLARLAAAGPVRVHLAMAAKTLPDVASANVIAEWTGRERPGEVVLIGAHLDSWDVGQGAHDDGAGVAIVMEAMRLLRSGGRTPRRTIRVVLFTNEENGLRGGKAYAKDHGSETHVAAIEADSGGFAPDHLDGILSAGALAQMQDVVTLLAPLGAARVSAGEDAGADIEELTGVPLLGLATEGSHYFDYHHTEADTLDKVNPQHLQMDAVAMAIIAYTLAEMETPLERGEPVAAATP
jgi:carboxypeptidase Q